MNHFWKIHWKRALHVGCKLTLYPGVRHAIVWQRSQMESRLGMNKVTTGSHGFVSIGQNHMGVPWELGCVQSQMRRVNLSKI